MAISLSPAPARAGTVAITAHPPKEVGNRLKKLWIWSAR
jgi:hypothetical protein